MNLLSLGGSRSFVVAKDRDGIWDVFHARPGSTRAEAWANACNVAGVPKIEFARNGWVTRRSYLEGKDSG